MTSSPKSQAGRPHLRLARGDGEAGQAKEAKPARDPVFDDAALLAALRAGDRSAVATLHDRARPIVDRTVARLLGRADVDREDVAQLALIELVTTIGRFRGDCSLDGWIAMITARVVYKQIRRRKLERRVFGVAPPEDRAPFPFRSETRDPILRNVLERVRGHLEALDPNKAWTFLLHDVCGHDLEEIAQIMDVSVAAAQTRLSRGRRELHQRIEADPELADWIEETGGLP